MKPLIKSLRFIVTAALCTTIVTSGSSFAGPPGKYRPHYPPPGHAIRAVPPGHQVVPFGTQRYRYHDGIYYLPGPDGFHVSRPPRGLVVSHLPHGFETLVIAGLTYFLFAGIYYQKVPPGYIVVDAPPLPQPTVPVVVDIQTVYVDTPLLNVRSGPGMGYAIICQVIQDTKLTVEGNADGWFFVRLPDGSTGWVMSGYIREFLGEGKG